MASQMLHTPVLIVGAGPVSAVLALELARNGVSTVVVEKNFSPARISRTYYLNSRSMELLRRLDLADAVREHGVDPDHSTDFLWTRNLRDSPVLVWHHPSVNQIRDRYATVNDGTAPVEPYQRVAGGALERLGREAMERHPLVDLRLGQRVIRLNRTRTGATVTILNYSTNHRYRVRARYAVACDGEPAEGRREYLDIPMDKSGSPVRFRSVHFRSGDPVLRRFEKAFATIAAGDLTLVAHGNGDRWTCMMPVPDGADGADPLAPLRSSLGAGFTVAEVVEVVEWEAVQSVAERYRDGPVFFAGSSAHQLHSAAGGYGENTGIADAVDLGWKMAAVVNGWGGPQLLASYERERRPVALFNRELSADLVEVGRRFTRLVLAGASREQLAGILQHDVHRIDDLGVQLGYRYDRSPIVWHDRDEPPTWQWRRLTASTWPGMRAPAVRMADGRQLFDRLGPGFTLVDLSGTGMGEPLVKAAKDRGIPMDHLCVEDAAVRACWERELVLVRPDHHVAWRDDIPPDDWELILHRVTGHAGVGADQVPE